MNNYILTFEKIEKTNLIAGVGTAGNIWIVLNALYSQNNHLDSRLFVDMEKNKTINSESYKIFETMNSWEYYFEQIDRPILNFIQLDSVKIDSVLHYEKRYTHSSRVSLKLKKLFWDNFSLRPEIKFEIDDFLKENFQNKITLGAQIRLTDMTNTANHNVKKFEDYVIKIKSILSKNPKIQQVFLATDDETVIEKLRESIDIPLISQKNIYRATNHKKDLNPYDRYEYSRPDHRYLLGKEVIIDIFLLSNCDYILKADVSCVSQLAVFFSQKIKKTFFVRSNYELLQTFLKKILRRLGLYFVLQRFVNTTKLITKKIKLLKKVKLFFKSNPEMISNYEKELKYLDDKIFIDVFPYKFKKKYKIQPPTFLDSDLGMIYVFHNGKKLYYPKDLNHKQVSEAYNALLIEQDINSPHYYFSENINFDYDDIFVDVGCSEGLISLDLVERASHIYLIETSERWIEALNHTFSPWKNKITIVNKIATDISSSNQITLDDLLIDCIKPIYVKLDVEGFERNVINGMSQLFERSKLKFSICTYHKYDDESYFSSFFKENDFKYEFSKGFMLFFWDQDFRPPFFRRGLIRAKNI